MTPARRVWRRVRLAALRAVGRHPRRHLPLVRPAEAPRALDRVVFLCGVHRSGKTFVEGYLHAHLNLAWLRAPVPDNEGQALQDVLPMAFDHGGPGRYALSPALRAPLPAPQDAAAMADRLLRCWTPWIAGTEPVLIEKSPTNILNIPFLRALFPGARFLIILRDPLEVAALTAHRTTARPVEVLANWQAAYGTALQAYDSADCKFLAFEAFRADPVAQSLWLGAWLGVAPRAQPLPLPPILANPPPVEQRADPPPLAPWPGVWDRFGYRVGG